MGMCGGGGVEGKYGGGRVNLATPSLQYEVDHESCSIDGEHILFSQRLLALCVGGGWGVGVGGGHRVITMDAHKGSTQARAEIKGVLATERQIFLLFSTV